MHPELLSSLAGERRRDLAAAMTARRMPHAGRRARSMTPPRLRISWSRTTLAAVAGRRRARSWIIVISATRTL